MLAAVQRRPKLGVSPGRPAPGAAPPPPPDTAPVKPLMSEQQFQAEIEALMCKISKLPEHERGALGDAAEQTRQRHATLRQTVAQLQESLDHLRLSVKYLVFDLEATRRENRLLRRMIEADDADEGE